MVNPADMLEFGDAYFTFEWSNLPDRAWGVTDLSWAIGFPVQFLYNPLVLESSAGLQGQARELRFIRARHGGRWNVAFCDGHVENLRGRKLFDVKNSAVLRRWNADNQPHTELTYPVP